MNKLNWERLRIYRAVLEGGSLAEAARRLGVSQPTVSRQVRALERDLDLPLVDITPDGALPTAAGLQLAPALDDMLRAADSIRPSHGAGRAMPVVRVTCGPWLSAFLGKNIHQLLGDPADAQVEIVSSAAFADLPRRQADIAIRNQRLSDSRITLRRLPDYACAVFGASSLVQNRAEAFDDRRFESFDWAALVDELDHFPTARWLSSRLQRDPVVRFSTSINLLDAVKSGSVLAVIPCFAGDPEDDIVRVSDPFVPDYGGHWLALADDVRRRPYVRRAADRIVAFLQENRSILLPT